MNRNIAIMMSYDGTDYHGWQTQANAVSIQGTLSSVASEVFKDNVKVLGCGRTDTGVHALKYVALLKTTARIPTERVPIALNSLLPNDISVYSAFDVGDDFHPTHSCIEKEYTYFIYTSKTRIPFLEKRALHYPRNFRIEQVREAAANFVGTHDFSSMRSLGTELSSTVRTVYACEVCRYGVPSIDADLISIRISADGFLYNMARTIVGTLLEVSSGKLFPRDISDILLCGDRGDAGPTALPYGLYMTNVVYPEHFGIPAERIGGIVNG